MTTNKASFNGSSGGLVVTELGCHQECCWLNFVSQEVMIEVPLRKVPKS